MTLQEAIEQAKSKLGQNGILTYRDTWLSLNCHFEAVAISNVEQKILFSAEPKQLGTETVDGVQIDYFVIQDGESDIFIRLTHNEFTEDFLQQIEAKNIPAYILANL